MENNIYRLGVLCFTAVCLVLFKNAGYLWLLVLLLFAPNPIPKQKSIKQEFTYIHARLDDIMNKIKKG